ncbi:MAG: RNA methyltransferase [Clostridia bacterium]|nr:RNA methyltransferase [Clostridia bacterium]
MLTITSVKNPQIVQLKGLKNRSARQEMGAYLVEGIKMAQEAVSRPGLARHLYLTEATLPLFEGAGCPVTLITDNVLAALCDTKTPQGAVCLVNLPKNAPLGKRIIVMDGVQDPGNVGTILRTADAAGFTGALMSAACADPYSPKVLRATMGSIFRLPIQTVSDLPSALKELVQQGFSVLSSQLDGEPFFQRGSVGEKFALVIGNEGNGVSDEVKAAATHHLALPMRGGAESLNAAIAAGIMMYDLTCR